jgi:hypothetical protein
MALNGVWKNELGSTMTLADDGQGGLTGTYITAAGQYQGVSFPLAGRYDTQPNDTGVSAIGWTVAWQLGSDNAHSVTAWSGQLHEDLGVIVATWLLTSETTEADAWGDTLVGQDTFTPTGQAPARALAPAASHPRTTG